ncbi:MAG: hypothetical protein V4668_03680 [Patescibacteria group bacterium]
MPPQNQFTTDKQKCPWYLPLCKVTPLSKFLAMVIFIIVPFIGGFVGYQIGLSDRDISSITTIDKSYTPPVNTDEIQFEKKDSDLYIPVDHSAQIKVTENPADLFDEYFSAAGEFLVASVTPSAIYGRRLHFVSSNADLYIMGVIQIEFDYHYGGWVRRFTPDQTSISKMPLLKNSQKIEFLTKTEDTLCEVFKCKSAEDILSGENVYVSPVYKASVKLYNPTLGYEVVPSDAGTPAYTVGFEKLEILQ